jgi:hypothetical protein
LFSNSVLFDERGGNLIQDGDYEEQIRYFERGQDHGRNLVWFFTPNSNKAEILTKAIRGEERVEKFVK